MHDLPGGIPDLPPRYSTTHRPSYLQGGYEAPDYSYAYPARPPSSLSSFPSRLARHSPDRRPRSPIAKAARHAVMYRRGPPSFSGPHGTPNITRTAPERRGNRDRRTKKKEKCKRNKKAKEVEESSEEEESEEDNEDGSGSDEHGDDDLQDEGYDPRYPALGSPRMRVRG
jgi:hypothetical protein